MPSDEFQSTDILASFVIQAEPTGTVVTETTSAAIQDEPNDPADIRFVARHEAGHAVAGIVLGIPVKDVDIIRRPPSDGWQSMGTTGIAPIWVKEIVEAGPQVAKHYMIQLLAGPVAEGSINHGVHELIADTSDVKHVFEIAARLAGGRVTRLDDGSEVIPYFDDELRRESLRLIHEATDQANVLVKRYFPAIIRVEELLLQKKYLSGAEVEAIVEEVGQQAAKPVDV